MKLFMHMCSGVISIKHSFLEWRSGLRDGAFGVLRKFYLFLLWTLLLRLHISGPELFFSLANKHRSAASFVSFCKMFVSKACK